MRTPVPPALTANRGAPQPGLGSPHCGVGIWPPRTPPIYSMAAALSFWLLLTLLYFLSLAAQRGEWWPDPSEDMRASGAHCQQRGTPAGTGVSALRRGHLATSDSPYIFAAASSFKHFYTNNTVQIGPRRNYRSCLLPSTLVYFYVLLLLYFYSSAVCYYNHCDLCI